MEQCGSGGILSAVSSLLVSVPLHRWLNGRLSVGSPYHIEQCQVLEKLPISGLSPVTVRTRVRRVGPNRGEEVA